MTGRITRLVQPEKGEVSAFLLDTPDDGVIVIDALSEPHAASLLGGLARMGRTAGDVRHIVLTHSHRSHIGGAAALRDLAGDCGAEVRVWAHGAEAPVIEGLRPSEPTTLLPRRPFHPGVYKLQLGLTLGYYVQEYFDVRPSALAAPPCMVDRFLEDGCSIGPLRALHTPGHTPGCFSFYWPEERALFTGDVLVTWPYFEIGWRGLTLDNDENRRSLAQLASVGDIEHIGVGHGPPIIDDAADSVRRLVAGLVARRQRLPLADRRSAPG